MRSCSAALAALDRFGDPLDPLQSGVPCRADGSELSDSPRQLGVVHPIPLLAAGWRCPNQGDSVEDCEMLRHGLASDRKLIAQCRCRTAAVGEEQIEHPPPRRITDRGPQVIIDLVEDGSAHRRTLRLAVYGASRGR